MVAWARTRARQLGAIALVATVPYPPLAAQTFNALRDPAREMFEAFPEADGYRQIDRDVDQAARDAIEARLPFHMHFRELGVHTLYVALRGQRPLGLVFARSEESRWGLIEVSWRMTLELGVVGFGLHRCRADGAEAIACSELGRRVVGCRFDELRALLAHDEATGTERTHELATVIVRSSLKAIVIVESVWTAELAKLQDLGVASDAFPQGTSYRRFVADAPAAAPGAAAPLPGQPTGAIRAVRVQRQDGSTIGSVLWVEIAWDEQRSVLRWVLHRNDRIERVHAESPAAPAGLRAACRELEGTTLEAAAADGQPFAATARALAAALARMEARG